MSYKLLERRESLKPLTKKKTFSEKNDKVIRSVYESTTQYYKFEMDPFLSLSSKEKANYVDILHLFMNSLSDCLLGHSRVNPEVITEDIDGNIVEITPLKDFSELMDKHRFLLEDMESLIKGYLYTKSLNKTKTSIFYNDVVDFLNTAVELLQ